MKILFTTANRSAPSSTFYAELLSGLGETGNVSLEFYHRDYKHQDVILFMGYDPDVAKAREQNRRAKIGIIDPRPPFSFVDTVDFIVANGLEMKDYCKQWTDDIFIYYVYPRTSPVTIERSENGPTIFGYHGNSVHLHAMYPRVTRALEKLGQERDIELWAIYNIQARGKWIDNAPSNKYVNVKHIQWSPHVYAERFPYIHVGLVPGLIPIRNASSTWMHRIIGHNRFNADRSDYVLRFKVSSNPGRLIVFAQHKIPVIADLFPSAVQFIDDGKNGYLCNSEAAWYSSMRSLASSEEHRKRFAQALEQKVNAIASPSVMNAGLYDFLKDLLEQRA